MKKKVIGIAAAILVLAAGFFIYTIVRARTAAAEAVQAYNAAVQEYNTAISPYNEAASEITEANDKLQGVVDDAQAVLDQGKAAYEPDTQEQLESAVQKAGKSLVEVPVQIDPLEEREVPGSLNSRDLELAQHEAETALKAVEEAKRKVPEIPAVPDYTRELDAVQTAQKKYEDSVQKLANITAPKDSFVMERIERIETVVEADAVTAEHDPNGLLGKKDGYIGCVYFLDGRVDRELLPQEAFSKKKDGEEDSQETPEESSSGAASAQASESASAEETAAAGEAADSKEAAGTSETAGGAEASAAGETAGSDGTAAASEIAASDETLAAGEAAASDDTAAAGESAALQASAATGETAAVEQKASAAGKETKKEKTADVVMIGTAGGGAVEVFATEEEAKKRAEYIEFFKGSVMDAGPCRVEGTCVIRASKYLEEKEQQKLINEVREALLAVDG